MTYEKPQFDPEEAWREKKIDTGVIPKEELEYLAGLEKEAKEKDIKVQELWGPKRLEEAYKRDKYLPVKIEQGLVDFARNKKLALRKGIKEHINKLGEFVIGNKDRKAPVSMEELSNKASDLMEALNKNGVAYQEMNFPDIIKRAYMSFAEVLQQTGEVNPWEVDIFKYLGGEYKSAGSEKLETGDFEGHKKAEKGLKEIEKAFLQDRDAREKLAEFDRLSRYHEQGKKGKKLNPEVEEKLGSEERIKAIEGRAYLERLLYDKERGLKDKKLKEIADKMERLPEDIKKDKEWRQKQQEEVDKRSD